MQPPEGYTLEKCLGSTPGQSIYRAVRDRDRCEVVLKICPADPADDPSSALAREFEALRAIEPGCGVRALELVSTAGARVLVLEDFPGGSPGVLLEVAAFLDVAVRAARALAGVHRARWLHRNLAPEALLVHPVTRELRLTSFECAAPLGAPADPGVDSQFEHLLAYAAPEQTGRTERGVDARSDLYALGAVFYELLVSFPPFDSSDPLELIQAHVARRPRSPLELRPDLPPTLARITLRLLEKEPEDRYQTAEALAVDLESARDQLTRTGRIDDEMPLASADVPYRPLFRRAVYGREPELESLRTAYRRAVQGGRELLLMRGLPGIGKSALVPELYRPLAEDGGYLVQGKFDLYRRHVPYAGFSSAFGGLAEQILSESETRVSAWRETLSGALGALTGVIADLAAPLRSLLGETPPVPALDPGETQQRLGLAVQRLVRAAAERAHPLVLFLDDLQWADAGSLYLLEQVLRADSIGPLLVIGAYRQNEVDLDHPFGRLRERLAQTSVGFTELELGPLDETAATQLLADALGASPDQARALAVSLAGKSGNNPLLLQQCVYHLHQLGVIHFERGRGWRWDAADAAVAELPQDPAGMMGAKLARLPRELREALQLASCAGDHFSLELLLELSRLERKPLESALYALCDEGLIAPARAGFRFVHDRIREAAQAQLSERERARLHAEAAALLLAKTPESELDARALEIADHLILASAELRESDRARAIALHARAGGLSLRCGAASSAVRYYAAGEQLFVESDWERDREHCFALFLGSADAAYQLGEMERAELTLERLQARALESVQEMIVIARRISVLTSTRERDAIELTLSTLRRLGVHWPRDPSWLRVRLAILRTDWLLRGRLEKRVLPEVSPTDRHAVQGTIVAAGAYALMVSSPGLLTLATSHRMRVCLRYGAPSPGYVLAGYSSSRGRFLRKLDHLERYGRTAESWLRSRPHARAQFNLYVFHHGWFKPRRVVAESLLSTLDALNEAGDIEYLYYATGEYCAHTVLSGDPLEPIVPVIETVSRSDARFGGLLQVVRVLRGGSDDEVAALCELGASEAEALRPGPLFEGVLRPYWAMALCVFGEYTAAAAQAERMLRYALSYGSLVTYLSDCLMVQGLGHAVLARSSDRSARRRARRVLQQCLAQLADWASDSPDAVHMRDLLVAERARLSGRCDAALLTYQNVAERARERGLRHHAALAHERRAELLRELGREAECSAAFGQARELYREWGAEAKVRQLDAMLRRGAVASGSDPGTTS